MSEQTKNSVVGGMKFSVVSIDVNCCLSCPKNCFDFRKKICDFKSVIGASEGDKSVRLTKVIISVLNATDDICYIRQDDWKLVLSDGVVINSVAICGDLYPAECSGSQYGCDVFPKTVAKIALFFPDIQGAELISALIYYNKPIYTKIVINELSTDILKDIEQVSRITTINDSRLSAYRNRMNRLSELWHTVSMYSHSIQKELEIQRQIDVATNELLHILEEAPPTVNAFLHDWIMHNNETAEINKQALYSEKKEKDKWLLRVDELRRMDSYEFEQWVADLFKALGYVVEITPPSNDKGIDVFCRKNGELVVIQCKKWDKTIGSPDVQQFIGAMRNANADKGVIVTTGTFSLSAEIAASNENILLYDYIGIMSLVNEARK